MFIPSSAFLSSMDPKEIHRLNTGRPASRSEIVERHLRDHRFSAETITPDRSLQDPGFSNAKRTQARQNVTESTPNPVVSIRRSLSRALITFGERINPEAA